MSGSLQRRKKSKRKWKRLWFLLKDKVLYTFTACEVRGHRVSHTSPKTLKYSHAHFITAARTLSILLLWVWSRFGTELFNGYISTFQLFFLTRFADFMQLIKGFSVLSLSLYKYASECCMALFFLTHETFVIHILLLTAKLVFFNSHICAWHLPCGFFRIKWPQRVYLCKASPLSWLRGQRERKAAMSSIFTTRRPSTTRSGLMINTLHAG